MSKARCMFVVIAMLAAAGSVFAANVYVDANQTGGANNGTSWADAFRGSNGLVLGIAAGSGNTIMVAEGTYLPTNAADPSVSFTPAAGTTLLGGYSTRNLRAGLNNVVIRDQFTYFSFLSGDLLGDDTALDDNFYENPSTLRMAEDGDVGKVVENTDLLMRIAAENVTVDGFIFTKGHVNSNAEPAGGGILVSANNSKVKNCTFMKIKTGYGAAVYYAGVSSGEFDYCLISGNMTWARGQIYLTGSTNVIIKNSMFTKNSSDWDGDSTGVYVAENSSAKVYDCVFDRNCATNKNSSGRQGGLTVRASSGAPSSLEAYNCVLTNNIIPTSFSASPGGGGAVTVHGSENATGTALIKNCLIANNSMKNATGAGAASQGGAGVRVALYGVATIENCTIVNNTGDMSPTANPKGCGVAGSVMSAYPDAKPVITIKNSIVWGNQYDDVQLQDIAGVPQGTCTISYSCIDNSDGDPNNICTGTGVITTDPQFVVGDPMFNVQATSPTIDMGDPTSDWSKEPKCNGERINMGYTGNTGKATPKVTVANVLDGDVNCDGNVDLVDFSKLASEWLQ